MGCLPAFLPDLATGLLQKGFAIAAQLFEVDLKIEQLISIRIESESVRHHLLSSFLSAFTGFLTGGFNLSPTIG
jgi:predicted PurR-regulated permease PerM